MNCLVLEYDYGLYSYGEVLNKTGENTTSVLLLKNVMFN